METPSAIKTSTNSNSKDGDGFSRFDVVSDASDHYFFNTSNVLPQTIHKRIVKEWKMLEKDLPESIFVRVYDTRIDLLRAVIVGTSGTPYHDGLFIFDFFFPSAYPNVAPYVHYRSYGLQMHPFLQRDGKVCLSLLSTYHKKKCEMWNPSDSTVFQVLLSIQALVLNENPLYNSAPVFHRLLGEKISESYKEKAFLSSCQAMVYTIQRPPKNFELFVSQHVRRRGSSILMACEAYVNGRVQVGLFDALPMPSRRRPTTIKVSAVFKGRMEVLYPQLVYAFRRSGALIEPSMEHLRVEKTGKSANQSVAGEKNVGVGKKLIMKIRKMFGIKNEKTKQKGKPVGIKA